MREIKQNDARKIGTLFENHLQQGLDVVIYLENQHYYLAKDWIRQFNLPLKSLDALHLSVCLLNNLCLVTGDQQLYQSAIILDIDVQYLSKIK